MSDPNSNNEQVFGAIYELLEWVFDTKFALEDRGIFESEVFQGWGNADESDQDFIAHLLQLKEAIWSATPSARKRAKQQTRMHFRKMFKIRESNDRGRLVATLHSLIERRAPGITGLAAGPLRVIPQLTVPPQPPPQPQMPAQPMPAVPAGGSALTPYAAPSATAVPMAVNEIDSVMDLMTRTQRHVQKVGLDSAISKMQHDSIMNVIKNMG